jgi:predicted thioesterase
VEELKPGLSAEVTEFVTEQLTAASVRSGLVSAYATPAMSALMENASVAAIQKCMPKGQTSVGVEMNVKHIAATPVGVRVRARAEVIAVEGRRIVFQVQAWDHKEIIGEGIHTRVVVDAARFKDKLEKKMRA